LEEGAGGPLDCFYRIVDSRYHIGPNDKLLFAICQEAGEKTSEMPVFETEIAIFFLFSFGAF